MLTLRQTMQITLSPPSGGNVITRNLYHLDNVQAVALKSFYVSLFPNVPADMSPGWQQSSSLFSLILALGWF